MPSPFYETLSALLSEYMPGEKVDATLRRQLNRVETDSDHFDRNHFSRVIGSLKGAVVLYVREGGKIRELYTKLDELLG